MPDLFPFGTGATGGGSSARAQVTTNESGNLVVTGPASLTGFSYSTDDGATWTPVPNPTLPYVLANTSAIIRAWGADQVFVAPEPPVEAPEIIGTLETQVWPVGTAISAIDLSALFDGADSYSVAGIAGLSVVGGEIVGTPTERIITTLLIGATNAGGTTYLSVDVRTTHFPVQRGTDYTRAFTAAGTTLGCAIPASTQVGDTLIAVLYHAATLAADGTPSGWTQIGATGVDSRRVSVFKRTATGTDAFSVNFTAASDKHVVIMPFVGAIDGRVRYATMSTSAFDAPIVPLVSDLDVLALTFATRVGNGVASIDAAPGATKLFEYNSGATSVGGRISGFRALEAYGTSVDPVASATVYAGLATTLALWRATGYAVSLIATPPAVYTAEANDLDEPADRLVMRDYFSGSGLNYTLTLDGLAPENFSFVVDPDVGHILHQTKATVETGTLTITATDIDGSTAQITQTRAIYDPGTVRAIQAGGIAAFLTGSVERPDYLLTEDGAYEAWVGSGDFSVSFVPETTTAPFTNDALKVHGAVLNHERVRLGSGANRHAFDQRNNYAPSGDNPAPAANNYVWQATGWVESLLLNTPHTMQIGDVVTKALSKSPDLAPPFRAGNLEQYVSIARVESPPAGVTIDPVTRLASRYISQPVTRPTGGGAITVGGALVDFDAIADARKSYPMPQLYGANPTRIINALSKWNPVIAWNNQGAAGGGYETMFPNDYAGAGGSLANYGPDLNEMVSVGLALYLSNLVDSAWKRRFEIVCLSLAQQASYTLRAAEYQLITADGGHHQWYHGLVALGLKWLGKPLSDLTGKVPGNMALYRKMTAEDVTMLNTPHDYVPGESIMWWPSAYRTVSAVPSADRVTVGSPPGVGNRNCSWTKMIRERDGAEFICSAMADSNRTYIMTNSDGAWVVGDRFSTHGLGDGSFAEGDPQYLLYHLSLSRDTNYRLQNRPGMHLLAMSAYGLFPESWAPCRDYCVRTGLGEMYPEWFNPSYRYTSTVAQPAGVTLSSNFWTAHSATILATPQTGWS